MAACSLGLNLSAHAQTQDPAARCPDPSQITDSDPDRVFRLGETLNYKIIVRNTGNVTLENVSIDEPMPLENILYCWSADLSKRDATGSLAPGETLIMLGDHVVTQADVARGHIENTATIGSVDPVGGQDVCDLPDSRCSATALKQTGADGSHIAPIPTLGEWAGLLLTLMLGALGGAHMIGARNKRQESRG